MASHRSKIISEEIVTPHTKIRHLKLKSWNKLIDILSIGDRWIEIASRIKKPDDETKCLYSATDISTLEVQVKRGQSPAQAFLQHWSTMGHQQPTVENLIQLLVDSHLYQAAKIISQELLKDSNAFSQLTEDLLKSISEINPDDKNEEFCDNEANTVIQTADFASTLNENLSKSLSKNLDFPSILKYPYRQLMDVTRNFCDVSTQHGGCKIGEGSFGLVYRAYMDDQWVAIKKLKEAVDNQFLNELQILSEYKHENLLPLLGYSNDGPYCLLVYRYMLNGSLQERLACVDHTAPLSWITRISIACGTARGINHLHNFSSEPRIHRDIKSANILLDDHFVAKVGDFGLARIGKNSATSSVVLTSIVYGTSVYMAREAFNGEVSVKLDSFSFGVVLLELLTGLQPYDSNRENTDLMSHIRENCGNSEDIIMMLDPKAGNWNPSCALSLYDMSKNCTEERRKNRYTIEQVLPHLEELVTKYKNE